MWPLDTAQTLVRGTALSAYELSSADTEVLMYVDKKNGDHILPTPPLLHTYIVKKAMFTRTFYKESD